MRDDKMCNISHALAPVLSGIQLVKMEVNDPEKPNIYKVDYCIYKINFYIIDFVIFSFI